MMYSFRKSVGVVLVALLTGCGAVLKNPEIHTVEFQRELDKQTKLLQKYKENKGEPKKSKPLFKHAYQYDAFVSNYMDRMLYDSVNLCKYTMYNVGLQFADKGILKGKYYSKKYNAFPQVYGVSTDFPAEVGGIKRGDIILSVNGVKVDNVLVKNLSRTLHQREVNSMRIFRPTTGNKYGVKLRGKKSCQMMLYTYKEQTLNAMANGKAVFMYSGLMNFLGKREYIQTVLAHEISHNIMAHRYRSQRNMLTGLLAGALLGAIIKHNGGGKDSINQLSEFGLEFSQSYSPEFEEEADYLGVYLMARSGLDISNVANTWRRMSLLSYNAHSLSQTITHPASPKRFVALVKTVNEIKEKIRRKKPLLVIFKDSNWQEIRKQQVSHY